MKTKHSKTRTYKLWTYDVWGNAEDGFEVNDRFGNGLIKINCKARIYNVGTPHEFTAWDPTNLQLSRAVCGVGLEWDGESDGTLYASLQSNGKPVCELELQSE